MKRINFKTVEIENFLSVGKTPVKVDFNTGINVITGINHDKEDSKNGVGKSTIADAVFFCLFGTTIRDLKNDDIVNNVTRKKCRVKIHFDVVNDGTTTMICSKIVINPSKKITIVEPKKGKVLNQDEYDAIMEKKMREMEEKMRDNWSGDGDGERVEIRIGG